ncbi:MAG: DUF1957 domain-containing protein [Planctomycetes bacterium]|nr:DUF1957 domain-containing protein [Planctomycetota bacterium]
MRLGHLAFVLHAHLPFVRHPEHPEFLEEDWLFEALTETYLPLIQMLEDLERDSVDWHLTMSVTPTLAAMLSDPLLQDRYQTRLKRLVELAGKELERTRWEPEFHHVARMYLERFTQCQALYERLGRNPIAGLKKLKKSGRLELIGCAATHGYLPLLSPSRKAQVAQVEIGCREFERHFGFRPKGMWLPECGYTPGADQILQECGVDYFFVDTHGILLAEPKPRFGAYAPIRCPETNVVAFGRDQESSRQVWSKVEGYPGDPWYRDFYRDVGYDLDYEYIRPYLNPFGERGAVGVKYYRITGAGDTKLPYDPGMARVRAAEHAANFLFNREKQAEWVAGSMDGVAPLLLAPYDAELFGHWWYEGPIWLEEVFRQAALRPQGVVLTTPSRYLESAAHVQVASPSFSSWGDGGYSSFWLNGTNDWIYPHLHEMAWRMEELARDFPEPTALVRRALNQAARELLLGQSSDWAFSMTTGAHAEYAVARIRSHVVAFLDLDRQIRSGDVNTDWLADLESRNNLFPDIDYQIYS